MSCLLEIIAEMIGSGFCGSLKIFMRSIQLSVSTENGAMESTLVEGEGLERSSMCRATPRGGNSKQQSYDTSSESFISCEPHCSEMT